MTNKRLPSLALAAVVACLPLSVPAQSWTGNLSNSMNTAGNWTPGLPVSGGSLTFTAASGTGGLLLNNNLTSGSFNVNAINFNAGAPAFVIGDGTTAANVGNTFVLEGNVSNNSSSLQTINNPFSMTGIRTFSSSNATAGIRLGGDISGTGGGILVSSAGSLTLAGNNTFTGGVSVGSNTLNLASATALGTGSLTIGNGATLNNTSGSALTLTTNNPISWGANSWTFGGSNNLTFGSGAVSASSSTVTLNGSGRTLAFGGTLTNTSTSNTDIAFAGAGNKVVFGGMSLNADTVSARANTISGTSDVTITGPVVGGGRNDHILGYGGTGTLTLQGANTFTGQIRTTGPGTVLIDANTATFSAANTLATNMGGTINYDNTTSTGSRSVTFGALTFGGGEGTLQTTRTAAQNVSLTLPSNPTRGGAAVGNIVVSGGTNGVNNGVIVTSSTAGFMNGGIYFNGADFAATSGSGTYVRALNYGVDANTVAVNTITAGRHVKLTTTPTAQNTISLLTLNLSGSTDFSLNAAQTLTLSNGLLKSGGGASTISGGNGISQTVEFIVRADTTSDLLTISNNITSNATNALTKAGAGTLVLSGTNSFASGAALTINNGAVRATDGGSLPSAAVLALRGGVLESSGTFSRSLGTAAGNVNWSTASGGFAANGGVLNIQLNGGTSPITWAVANFVGNYRELVLGSVTADNRVDFQNGLTLGTVQRSIQVIDNPNSTSDIARISGAITGGAASNALAKTGLGTLELTASNSYTGGTLVSAGTLLINNTTGSGTGTGIVNVASGARIGGDGTIGGSLSLTSGAQFVFTLGQTLDVTGPVTLADSFGIASLVNADGSAINWASVTDGTYTLIGNTSDFSNISNFGLANAASIGGGRSAYFQNGSLQLVVVPEPGTFALLLGGLAVIGLAARRRRA